MRKPLISKKLWTVFATHWVFSGDISSMNFCLGDLVWKSGVIFSIFSIIWYLGYRYIGQFIRKCTSSSTAVGQKGQNRSSLGVLGLVCRSFSMLSRLLESRNLVKDCRTVVFLISSRYFSRPSSVLRSAYVRSLLSGLLISWNAFLKTYHTAFCVAIYV